MKIEKFFTALLFILIPVCLPAEGIEDMRGLELKNVKIPFYKDKKLQLVAFSQYGKRQDQIMIGHRTWLDVLLENADVDKIVDGWQEKVYPLNASLPEVLDFWRKRYLTSQSALYTDRCSIDQSRNEAFGDDPVFMRMPMLDLNGIGFHADFASNVIEVTSEVKIVARKSDADPRKLLTGSPKPSVYQLVHAESDSLRMDMANNELMLIGNVKVVDGKSTLTCDRLTVFMNNDESSSKEPMLKGVSRVLADGDVVLTQMPERSGDAVQVAKSDHLDYTLKIGIITLTGDDRDPEVMQGQANRLSGKRIELLRNEDRLFVFGDCKVTFASGEGQKRTDRIITSRRGEFDNRSRLSTFHEDVVVVDGDTILNSGILRIYLAPDKKNNPERDLKGGNVEKIIADKDVKITSYSEKADPGVPGGKRRTASTICSQQAILDYTVDKMIFYSDVKVRDEGNALDCDRLDIFLTDKKSAVKGVSSSGVPGENLGSRNKTVTKTIASGHVIMINKLDELHTDLMTLFFRELPADVKPTPGMFQSGGTQLIKIICDGSVHAFSNEKDVRRMLKAEHAMSDLLKDYSEFHEKVEVHDGNNEIYCRDMYVFTKRSDPESEKNKTAVPKPVSIDDDPFALDGGAASIPARISLSKGIDLTRLVCKREVEFVQKNSDGKTQRAGGDQAVYTVADKETILTAEPPARPWMRADGRLQHCDIIRGNMESGDMQGIGNVQVIPDPGRNLPLP
ncbi:MAG: hypothetical protein IKA71_07815 [Lentisphaeria bacterium]|nr:hypothetical protein [Lentisphaeria bacterium]